VTKAIILIWVGYVNFAPSAATPRNSGSTTKVILLQCEVAATGVLTHLFSQRQRIRSPAHEKSSSSITRSGRAATGMRLIGNRQPYSL
jgi:hypothetical protein